jgi:hypothetical protein
MDRRDYHHGNFHLVGQLKSCHERRAHASRTVVSHHHRANGNPSAEGGDDDDDSATEGRKVNYQPRDLAVFQPVARMMGCPQSLILVQSRPVSPERAG